MNIMVVLYSFDLAGSERLGAVIASRLHKDGINVSVMAIYGDMGPISDALIAEGIPCFTIDAGTKSKLCRWLDCYRYFKQQCVDVIHVHHISMFNFLYWPAVASRVKRIVVTEHTDFDIRRNRRLTKRTKKSFLRADYVTVIHRMLYDYFVEDLNCPLNKIEIIYNGVDSKVFYPNRSNGSYRAQLGVDKKKYLLGWIGRFHRDKDIDTLLHSIALLSNDVRGEIQVIVVGDGEGRENATKLLKKLNLDSCIKILGVRQDIPELMRNLDVLLLTSSTEGVPMVILEAMSSGVPCISTSVGGISEVINDGENGWLVPPKDPVALSECITSVLSDEERLKGAGISARKSVVERFDVNIMTDNYKKILIVT